MGTHFRIPKTEIEFNPPVYFAKKATKPFVLDGNLDKPFWEDAEFTDYFVDIEGSSRPIEPRFQTRAKMLWDKDNLYFGAVLEGDEIWGHLTERESIIFQDNDFEIFVDPDSDTHQYFEFEMNAKNTVWDLMLTKPYRDNGKPVNNWDINGLRSAVHIDGELNNPKADNKRWMVEVVMPFAVLREGAMRPESPKVSDYYRINFSRVQWNVDIKDNEYIKVRDPKTGAVCPEDNWVWAPTGVINIHYPELWGFVFFTENGESYEIPEEERVKWQLRRLYYMEHEFYDQNGRFTSEFNEVKGNWEFAIQPVIEITTHSFEISTVIENGITISIFSDGRTEQYHAKQ